MEEFMSVFLLMIWARLPVIEVHAAAQLSMREAGPIGDASALRAPPLTARTALVRSVISNLARSILSIFDHESGARLTLEKLPNGDITYAYRS